VTLQLLHNLTLVRKPAQAFADVLFGLCHALGEACLLRFNTNCWVHALRMPRRIPEFHVQGVAGVYTSAELRSSKRQPLRRDSVPPWADADQHGAATYRP
jgi:hypothetical protein